MKQSSIILTILLAFCIPSAVNARQLTPEEALQRARTGRMAHKIRAISSKENAVPAITFTTAKGNNGCYVFTGESGKGFMILSADTKGEAIIGYSDTGYIDCTSLPPQFEAWLKGYGEMIEATPEDESGRAAEREPGATFFDPIKPMVEARWNQDAPYNELCPLYMNGERCVTGCANTAIAQIMHYHKWPEYGMGKGIHTDNINGRNVRITADFENTRYEWEKMLPTYKVSSFKEQRTAVATLMAHLGVATRTDYAYFNSNTSGTLVPDVAGALISYFRYSPSVNYIERLFYSEQQWKETIYNELKEGRPVFYAGSSGGSGGHAFVCDGYDGEDRYHFNWGWGGNADGYFSLSSLTPNTTTGIGGGNFNFTDEQNAIIGIKPIVEGEKMTASVVTRFGITVSPHMGWRSEGFDVSTDASDRDYLPGFQNMSLTASPTKMELSVLLTEKESGTGYVLDGEVVNFYSETTPRSYHVSVPAEVPPGEYHMQPIARFADTESDWTEISIPDDRVKDTTVELGEYWLKAYNENTTYGILRASEFQYPSTAKTGEYVHIETTIESFLDYYWGRIGIGIYDAKTMERGGMTLTRDDFTIPVEIPLQYSDDVRMPNFPGTYRIMICDDFMAPFAEAGLIEVADASAAEVVETAHEQLLATDGAVIARGYASGTWIRMYTSEGIEIFCGTTDASGMLRIDTSGMSQGVYIVAGGSKSIRFRIG